LDGTEYRHYSFARDGALLALEYSWGPLKSKIAALVDEIKKTPIDPDLLHFLESVVENFEKCVNKVVKAPKYDTFKDNSKDEPGLYHEIVLELPQIYSDFFYVFLKNIRPIRQNAWYESKPDFLKFRAYNCDLRHRCKNNNGSRSIDILEFDVDNGFRLLNQDPSRGQLIQGYWQVASMVKELRNHEEHWKKASLRAYLEKELNRKMTDPLNSAETTGNLIVLSGILLLMAYNVIEILQTWIDTMNLYRKKI
jgi:hypothetical protein